MALVKLDMKCLASVLMLILGHTAVASAREVLLVQNASSGGVVYHVVPTTDSDDNELGSRSEDGDADGHHGETYERYPVAELNWWHVETPYLISLWVLFASYAKIAFHLSNRLAKIFPESCLLIILGIIVGVIIYFAANDVIDDYTLDSDTFFLFLLPPIVLEAGYFMPNRAFFDNIGTILLYAVLGTLFNCFAIGASLYGIVCLGWVSVPLDFLDCLVFSSLISAVDPVAVLAVFEEVHVNESLYILVFGESLLNDAVTVVLYRMFKQFAVMGSENRQSVDYVLGLTSFFVISIGGTLIGIIWGLLTGFVTKFTDHVRVIEPLFVFLMSYLSYLTAEIFGFSGIMAIVFCGIIMKKYVEANISQKSHTTVKYFMKMLSSISETIIFMFLGLSAVQDDHVWDIAFILCTLFFCLFYRATGVIVLTALANWFRAIKVNKVEQFIMAYGGLRGAIAFSLVVLLEAPTPGLQTKKALMSTTCLIVIFFTVFVQGMSIKPLVDKLGVKRSTKHKPSMGEKIFTRLLDHAMAGVEDITGSHGHNYWRDRWEEIDRKYLQPLLLRELPEAKDTQILQVYTNLNIKDALEYVKSAGTFNLQHASPSIASFLRRNASSNVLGNSSDGILQHGVSDVCIDMQSVGGTGELASRHIDDAQLHHLQDVVFNSMHKTRKQVRYQNMKHHIHDYENENTGNLLHRSVHLHLKHCIRQRKRKAKVTKKLGHHSMLKDGVHKLTVPDVKQRSNDKVNNNGKLRFADEEIKGGPVEVKVHPPEAENSSSDDDECGITFKANPDSYSLKETPNRESIPLLRASPVSITMETDHSMESDEEEVHIEPSAAETWLPWKQFSEPKISERAKEEAVGMFGVTEQLAPSVKSWDNDQIDVLMKVRRNSVDAVDVVGSVGRRTSDGNVKAMTKGGDVIRKLLLRRQSEVCPPDHHQLHISSLTNHPKCHLSKYKRRQSDDVSHHHNPFVNSHQHHHYKHRNRAWRNARSVTLPEENPSKYEDKFLTSIAEKSNGSVSEIPLPPSECTPLLSLENSSHARSVDDYRICIADCHGNLEKESSV